MTKNEFIQNYVSSKFSALRDSARKRAIPFASSAKDIMVGSAIDDCYSEAEHIATILEMGVYPKLFFDDSSLIPDWDKGITLSEAKSILGERRFLSNLPKLRNMGIIADLGANNYKLTDILRIAHYDIPLSLRCYEIATGKATNQSDNNYEKDL